MCNSLFRFRFTSTRGGKPIGTANCPSPRSCKTVRGGRAVSPARGWSCSPCCASKPVTTWPLWSTAAQIPPGSSSTAWPTVTVGVTASGRCVLIWYQTDPWNEVVMNRMYRKLFLQHGRKNFTGLSDTKAVKGPQPVNKWHQIITLRHNYCLNLLTKAMVPRIHLNFLCFLQYKTRLTQLMSTVVDLSPIWPEQTLNYFHYKLIYMIIFSQLID